MEVKKVKAHSYLNQIESYKPGKSLIEGKETSAIKLSSNENALGSSKNAILSYEKHDKDVFRYADGSCSALRKAIAKKYEIAAEDIVCGAGSDEVLYLLASAYAGEGDEIIHSKHGFLMYDISARRVGATPISVPEKNLKTSVEAIITAISGKTKIIFLANPNNPTGSYLTNDEVKKLIDNTPKNVLIVFDHAYDEFVSDVSDYPNAIKLVQKNDNVVMTRTFSKIHGLASLRIGWCYSNREIADVLNKARGPFNVGGPAQVSAKAAIEDENFVTESLAHNNKWLKKIFEEASGYKNIKALPSVANFILFDFNSEEGAKKANEKFSENNIIVRQVGSYFLPNCLRITIGTDQENEFVLKILAQLDLS